MSGTTSEDFIPFSLLLRIDRGTPPEDRLLLAERRRRRLETGRRERDRRCRRLRFKTGANRNRPMLLLAKLTDRRRRGDEFLFVCLFLALDGRRRLELEASIYLICTSSVLALLLLPFLLALKARLPLPRRPPPPPPPPPLPPLNARFFLTMFLILSNFFNGFFSVNNSLSRRSLVTAVFFRCLLSPLL